VQQTEWSPPTVGIAACGVFGLILATGAVTLITDAPGRILVGIAAVGLIVFASLSWRARPKLAISDNGLVTRGWVGTSVLQRADIKNNLFGDTDPVGKTLKIEGRPFTIIGVAEAKGSVFGQAQDASILGLFPGGWRLGEGQ